MRAAVLEKHADTFAAIARGAAERYRRSALRNSGVGDERGAERMTAAAARDVRQGPMIAAVFEKRVEMFTLIYAIVSGCAARRTNFVAVMSGNPQLAMYAMTGAAVLEQCGEMFTAIYEIASGLAALGTTLVGLVFANPGLAMCAEVNG